jgi:hypothetical protein
METKVLTQEEITQLKSVQQDRLNLIERFGVLEIQKQEIKNQEQQLSNAYQELKQYEEQLGKQLQEKYGDGTINLEKGEFISN